MLNFFCTRTVRQKPKDEQIEFPETLKLDSPQETTTTIESNSTALYQEYQRVTSILSVWYMYWYTVSMLLVFVF